MRNSKKGVSIGFLLVVSSLLVLSACTHATNAPINLHWRTFTPDAGLSKDLKTYFDTHAGAQNVHVLVQFHTMPGLAQRKTLGQERGVTLLEPVPERAFFATIAPSMELANRLLDAKGGARWLGVIQADDKISPNLGVPRRPPPDSETATQRDAERRPRQLEAIVRFFGDVAADESRQVLARHGAQILEERPILKSFRVILSRRAVRALATEDTVKRIVPPPPPGKDDNDGARSLTGINIDYSSNRGLHDHPHAQTGFNVVIGQWEGTHVSRGHPDLAGRVVLGDVSKPGPTERAVRHSEDVAENHAFDLGEALYRDNDDNLRVSVQDDRLTPWGTLAPGEVASGDGDIGNPLIIITTNYYKFADTTEPYSRYQVGESIYNDADQNGIVGAGELRLTDVSTAPGYAVGTSVAPGDTDEGQLLKAFPSVTPHRHATHVAGTILGDGTLSADPAYGGEPFQWRGMAPRATLRSYDFDSLDLDYVDAAANDVTLSNNSWGRWHCHWKSAPTEPACYDLDSELYDSVISGRDTSGASTGLAERILIVGSAGNSGEPERYVDVNANGQYDDGEGIYEDTNDNGQVDGGDDFEVGNASANGTPLVNFALDEVHLENPPFSGGEISDGEGIYRDRDGSRSVTAGDERITPGADTGLPPCVLPCTVDAADSDAVAALPLMPFKLWGTVRVPNSAKNTLEVANITSDTKALAPTSGRGPTDDGRIKPDLAAPGSQAGLVPVGNSSFNERGIWSAFPPRAYSTMSGTSMSTPAVTGATAVLTEWYTIVCVPPYPPPELYRAFLIHAAEDLTAIPNVTGNFVGPDFAFGFGRVRVKEAIDLVTHHRRGTLSQPGETVDYQVTIGRMPALRVTLAWDDPPSPGDTTASLLNDLDLTLIAPDGTTYTPWELDPDNPSAPAVRSSFAPGVAVPAASLDRRNTVEQVVVDNAAAGTWTIRVKARALTLPTQTFAVVSEMLEPDGGSCDPTPAIDPWMRDHVSDTGAIPYTGPIDSPNIWNRNAADDQATNQPVVPGATNYLYAVIQKIGSPGTSARPVSVDIWATTASAAQWPDDFEYLGRLNKRVVSSGTRVGPLAWPAPAVMPPGGVQLYVRVLNIQDPIGGVETTNTDANIRGSNNITGRVLN
ncbi:MAG: S8 family serine peptidase [Rhodospirillales bacterium]